MKFPDNIIKANANANAVCDMRRERARARKDGLGRANLAELDDENRDAPTQASLASSLEIYLLLYIIAGILLC